VGWPTIVFSISTSGLINLTEVHVYQRFGREGVLFEVGCLLPAGADRYAPHSAKVRALASPYYRSLKSGVMFISHVAVPC